MELSSELVKKFVRNSNQQESSSKKFYYGKVTALGQGKGVYLEGSQTPTPIAAGVSVKDNDKVVVVIEDHKANVIGNLTSPPTDDTVANRAQQYADLASAAASAAQQDANTAKTSAANALTAAQAAQTDATRAFEAAESAVEDAATAKTSAESAVEDAATAKTSAQNALASAAQAATQAANALAAASAASSQANAAYTEAQSAAASASRANIAANSAVTQLSIIEDVAGTLAWIQEHGSYVASTDTSVVDGKVYFTYDSQTQDYTPIVSPDPEADPSEEGWYVLDISDTQSDYIMAHLAVTSRGLWILPSGMGTAQDEQHAPGYKMLLTASSVTDDPGMYIYDDLGALVSSFGESVTFASNRPQYIGGEDAYIIYYDSDNDGVPDSIRIGGDRILLGGDKTLTEVLTELENTPMTLTIEYSYTESEITFNAKLMSRGVDVTRNFDASCYIWYFKDGMEFIDREYSIQLESNEMNYGKAIYLEFIKREPCYILDSEGNRILTGEEDAIIAYAEVD